VMVNVKRIASTRETIFTRKAPLLYIFTDSMRTERTPKSHHHEASEHHGRTSLASSEHAHAEIELEEAGD